jgi:anti-sigma regulatory factor (Ser/Thr protein kinase)
MPRELCLTIPASSGALPCARAALRRWLSQIGVDPRIAADVLVAVWEACANAVEHPLQPTTASVHVRAEAGEETLAVSVRDSGRWQPRRSSATRGFGLALVEGLMDDVLIERRPDGTEVRMIRRLGTREPGPKGLRRGAGGAALA